MGIVKRVHNSQRASKGNFFHRSSCTPTSSNSNRAKIWRGKACEWERERVRVKRRKGKTSEKCVFTFKTEERFSLVEDFSVQFRANRRADNMRKKLVIASSTFWVSWGGKRAAAWVRHIRLLRLIMFGSKAIQKWLCVWISKLAAVCLQTIFEWWFRWSEVNGELKRSQVCARSAECTYYPTSWDFFMIFRQFNCSSRLIIYSIEVSPHLVSFLSPLRVSTLTCARQAAGRRQINYLQFLLLFIGMCLRSEYHVVWVGEEKGK